MGGGGHCRRCWSRPAAHCAAKPAEEKSALICSSCPGRTPSWSDPKCPVTDGDGAFSCLPRLERVRRSSQGRDDAFADQRVVGGAARIQLGGRPAGDGIGQPAECECPRRFYVDLTWQTTDQSLVFVDRPAEDVGVGAGGNRRSEK